MRKLPETKTGAAPQANPRTFAALGLAVALLAFATPARAQEAQTAGSCALRYHASLKRIAEGEYQTLKMTPRAPGTVQPGEPGLPGNLIFPPVSAGKRTSEETAALRYAASLARAAGRTGRGTDADAAWMAERLRTALGDYLTQSPSPYLCGGVKDYIAELRADARRLGPPPIQREALIAAQKAVVARVVAAALAAMKPVPQPSAKPVDAVSGGGMDGLRPATGIERTDTTLTTGSTERPGDPDLPERAAEAPETFETTADLMDAIERLAAAARAGGFIAPPQDGAPVAATFTIPATSYPVLARLAEARPIVTGARPAVSNRTVRLQLAIALSAIETLDYLMRARTEVPDPYATALEGTFEAILKAHEADCTCSN